MRIPDIEALDRKKSMVFLADDPRQILKFIGLDPERWFKRFANQDEMFDYASGCRLFWVKPVIAEDEAEEDVIVEVEGIGGQEGGEEGKKKYVSPSYHLLLKMILETTVHSRVSLMHSLRLKHNDRQRMSKRPIFRDWMEVYIPKLREKRQFGNTGVTRDGVRDEAFEAFGVKEEFVTRQREWKLVKHQHELWTQVIKGGVPEDIDPQKRSASIKLLKLVIMEGQVFEGAVPKAAEKDAEGFFDVEEVQIAR